MTSNGGKRWEPGDKSKDRENAEMSVSTNDPVCARCKGTSSMIWQRDQRGAVICLDCHAAEKAAIKASSNSTSDSTTFTGKQNKTSKSSHQVSSSSSSSSDSSTGIATRRSTRSHERAKAKQLQQKEDLAKTESGNGCFEEVEDTVGMDDQLAKDKTKLALNDLSKQHSPSSRAETVTAPSSGGPPSPCSSVSRRALRQGQPMPAPESQPYILTCSSLEHQVSTSLQSNYMTLMLIGTVTYSKVVQLSRQLSMGIPKRPHPLIWVNPKQPKTCICDSI